MVTLYRVVWKDAVGGSNVGWRPLAELKEQKTATVVSCGAMIYEDDDTVVICPHVIVEGDKIIEGDAEITIPKGWIVSSMKMATFPPGD